MFLINAKAGPGFENHVCYLVVSVIQELVQDLLHKAEFRRGYVRHEIALEFFVCDSVAIGVADIFKAGAGAVQVGFDELSFDQVFQAGKNNFIKGSETAALVAEIADGVVVQAEGEVVSEVREVCQIKNSAVLIELQDVGEELLSFD